MALARLTKNIHFYECLALSQRVNISSVGSENRTFDQLYEGTRRRALESRIPDDINVGSVFANNEIALSDIKVYGFDYDYTLAAYSTSLQSLIYELSKQALCHTKNYPKALEKLKMKNDFAIRGLHFDLKKGLFLKLDAFHHIQKDTVYRGLSKVPWAEVLQEYGGDHIPVSKMNQFHGPGSEMFQFVDMFALPEILLIAQVIEFFRANYIAYDPEYVFWDVHTAVQSIHQSGELHKAITDNLDKYLERTQDLTELLQRLRNSNKSLFLISNSGFPFIDAGMTYMLGKSWSEFFNVIIMKARKPDFFTSQKRPFRVYSPDTDSNMWHRVSSLEKGQFYSEGNLFDLQRFTGWSGSEVLYFGDHVYTDLADATLHHGWRTAAIIPELETEIRILNMPEFKSDVLLMVSLQKLIEAQQRVAPAEVMEKWLSELDRLKRKTKTLFNPQFGSLFRTYHNPTYFSRRLHRFADIYTAKLTNLLFYDVNHTFYPRRGALAHEKLYN